MIVFICHSSKLMSDLLKKCLNSDQTKANSPNIRKVFIQRDYTEGTDVKFLLKFPHELEEYVRQRRHCLTCCHIVLHL